MAEEKDKPGDNLTMVYWDYYNHDPKAYERMLSLHKKLSNKVYFAGGGWTWNGLVPDYGKAFRQHQDRHARHETAEGPQCVYDSLDG